MSQKEHVRLLERKKNTSKLQTSRVVLSEKKSVEKKIMPNVRLQNEMDFEWLKQLLGTELKY